jgi:hypothetical protein
MDDHNERIRQRAHEIWEEEGRPEGREYSHWVRARAEIGDEEGETPERASKADIALNALPPGTVPENPTAENPDRIVQLRPVPLKKKNSHDERDIDTQRD